MMEEAELSKGLTPEQNEQRIKMEKIGWEQVSDELRLLTLPCTPDCAERLADLSGRVEGGSSESGDVPLVRLRQASRHPLDEVCLQHAGHSVLLARGQK